MSAIRYIRLLNTIIGFIHTIRYLGCIAYFLIKITLSYYNYNNSWLCYANRLIIHFLYNCFHCMLYDDNISTFSKLVRNTSFSLVLPQKTTILFLNSTINKLTLTLDLLQLRLNPSLYIIYRCVTISICLLFGCTIYYYIIYLPR